jgi:hypothetical protein
MKQIKEIKSKDRKHHGKVYEGTILDGISADIEKNKYIRLHGHRDNKYIDKTYNIGDLAEYDSYNFSYYGKITSISENTISIQPERDTANRRLNLYDFAWRNYDFTVAKAIKEFANWYD